ncbi:MAG TPA: YbaK/EbsC family protein, partial [Nitrospiria bacterium]|nr:YbaK/EbsC family protein [Nitrospiria bacterium]
REMRLPFKVLRHRTSYTAQEMAAALHIPGGKIAKVVVVHAGDRFVMTVLPAHLQVDFDRLAKILKSPKVRLATEEEMRRVFPDVDVGTELPFGFLYGLGVVMDVSLMSSDKITFAAGNYKDAIQMDLSDYMKLAAPEVESFAWEPSAHLVKTTGF